ncbi:aspartate aminotransferase family protein [Mycolicibacterium holsaticum]|uniref:aspartate aminotransferase family protein n=1 Tax=Mycolicibacterium holsaticum TaxID=152142 RepID=UPI001C7DFC0D|nr:aspartate aminotransferase family protein [Mycolicibacterium holsaticum]MDA4106741.1 4-aminobutyrate aminotransferase [Mycolicibacterium holsaticum DSM 44478 = JCM 12374]QZA12990.1 aspartate aminotransferase family protein [Mycolicibacterium holsaticum DSM 44478 = JCM 12374]UNC09535.1 aspartate aminotransferase family protein [Mycolicibacterium holsaticum DSM 44478 = JCM 12374]
MAELSQILRQATGVLAARGAGVQLFDEQERRYLDFTAGIGVTSTGHCHPRVVEAAQRQVATLIHGQYTTVLHRPLLTLVERLGEVLPPGLDRVFFANSGSEAIEAALRLSRQATGRPNVIVFHGGFHGRTVAAASMTTSGTKFRSGFAPLMAGVHVAPFPDPGHYGWPVEQATDFALSQLDYVLQTLSAPADTAAFFVEPVLGEGGYVPANERFFAGLRERADAYGILLVVDEVQTGFGRTGRFWGGEHFDAHPDVVVTAKGLASGFPLSGIAAPSALMDKAWPGSQGGTYGANAVACAAAVATLDVIADERLVQNAAERGEQLREALRTVADKYDAITDVRGLGLMIGVEFRDGAGRPDGTTAVAVQQEAARRGLLLLTCGAWGQVVRFIPALVVSADEVDEAAGVWSDAVSAVL